MWEVCLPLVFLSKTIRLDTLLQHLLALERELAQQNTYTFWLNALVDRIARFTLFRLRDVLSYKPTEVLWGRRSDSAAMSPASPYESSSSEEAARRRARELGELPAEKRMKVLESRLRERRASYVGARAACEEICETLLPLGDALVANTTFVFHHCMPDNESETATRGAILRQLGVCCEESGAYHRCCERDLYKRQLLLRIYVGVQRGCQ